jgi:hypothetical protein
MIPRPNESVVITDQKDKKVEWLEPERFKDVDIQVRVKPGCRFNYLDEKYNAALPR